MIYHNIKEDKHYIQKGGKWRELTYWTKRQIRAFTFFVFLTGFATGVAAAIVINLINTQ